jgi:hypothetical protein
MRSRTVSADQMLLAAIRGLLTHEARDAYCDLASNHSRASCSGHTQRAFWMSLGKALRHGCHVLLDCHPTPLFLDERSSSECSPLICETVLKEKLSKERLPS